MAKKELTHYQINLPTISISFGNIYKKTKKRLIMHITRKKEANVVKKRRRRVKLKRKKEKQKSSKSKQRDKECTIRFSKARVFCVDLMVTTRRRLYILASFFPDLFAAFNVQLVLFSYGLRLHRRCCNSGYSSSSKSSFLFLYCMRKKYTYLRVVLSKLKGHTHISSFFLVYIHVHRHHLSHQPNSCRFCCQ